MPGLLPLNIGKNYRRRIGHVLKLGFHTNAPIEIMDSTLFILDTSTGD